MVYGGWAVVAGWMKEEKAIAEAELHVMIGTRRPYYVMFQPRLAAAIAE
jgi:hypothetical protein